MSDNYDLIVIGGGPGGIAAAQAAAARKKRVAVLEKDGWGGTCTHRGCIPTKALLACSRFYTDLKKLKRVGVAVSETAVDFSAMKKHRDQMVRVAALGAQKMLADAQVETKTGRGEILSPREVRCTDAEGRQLLLKADHLLIAWGSRPQLLPGIRTTERILTSDGMLGLAELPSSLIIIGASFIGVEYATLLAELGVKVILVELLERILPQEDEEAAAFLQSELGRLGIAVHTSTRLLSLRESAGGVVLQVQKGTETMEMRAGCVLLCTGRSPVLHEEELDRLGLAYDASGVKVDETMKTSVAGIYAAGDVTGGMMLAHRAAVQGRVAAEAMFGAGRQRVNENVIPSVVYSHPPIARVGYTEKQAAAEGLAVEVVKSGYGANIIARAEIMGQGFVKAVFHGDKLLGAVVVGDHAAELLAPLALAVSTGLTRRELASWVLPHPTLGEILAPLIEG